MNSNRHIILQGNLTLLSNCRTSIINFVPRYRWARAVCTLQNRNRVRIAVETHSSYKCCHWVCTAVLRFDSIERAISSWTLWLSHVVCSFLYSAGHRRSGLPRFNP